MVAGCASNDFVYEVAVHGAISADDHIVTLNDVQVVRSGQVFEFRFSDHMDAQTHELVVRSIDETSGDLLDELDLQPALCPCSNDREPLSARDDVVVGSDGTVRQSDFQCAYADGWCGS